MFPYVELRKTLTSEGNKIYNSFPLGPVIYCKINFKINFHKKISLPIPHCNESETSAFGYVFKKLKLVLS